MTSRISENGISFFGAGGHNHDGVNSSLINTSSYSLFDFSPNYVGAQSRISRQQSNRTAMEDFIVRVVNSQVLSPAGITLEPNTLNGKTITANTITATQIAANTITATQIAANTITANNIAVGTITGTQIANGAIGNSQVNNVMSIINLQSNFVTTNATIQSTVYTAGAGGVGWAINAAGNAEFNNVTVRGTVVSGAGSIGGWTINTSSLTSGSTALYSNGQATFGNTTIFSNGRITNGSLIISASGALDATGAIVRGRIEADNGEIGGWDISGSDLIGGDVVADNVNGRYGILKGDGTATLYRYQPSVQGDPFYIKVDINNANPGITVTGTANSEFNSTRILSSFIETKDILLSGTGLLQRLAGKANTVHPHDFIPTSGLVSTTDIVFQNTNIGTNALGQLFQLRRQLNNSQGPNGQNFGDNFIQFVRDAGNGWTASVVSAIEFTGALSVGFNNISDERMKKDIFDMSDALSIVNKIRPVTFSWKDSGGRREDGFIAQELYEIYPSAVAVGSDDLNERPWGVYYGSFTPLLTAAIKELLVKVETLEDRIQTLEGV